MHSLFWKIFLSFWAALILFMVATVVSTSHYLENERKGESGANPMARLHRHMEEAEQIAQHQDAQALRRWLQEVDKRELIPLYAVDEHGLDLLQRPLPEHLEARLRRAQRGMHTPGAHRRMTRHRITLRDGQSYWLMPDFQSVTLGRVLRRPHIIAMPIVIATIISALVCLLLARYLTAPIARLRRATKQIAGGDLSQRLGDAMGSRQDELADLAHDFDDMARRLQILMQAQKQLLRDVSHELRSPLTRLQVALGLARKHANARALTEMDRIERETERLDELIGQLLSLSRLDSLTQTVEMSPLDLSELLEFVVSDAQYEAHSSAREVKLIRSTPTQISANAALLHSAFDNVVRNAIRHTSKGSCVELSLAHTPDAQAALIQISDHGEGVAPDMLERIFEPFVRADDARDRASGGYGLGLAIAQRAVQLHGGHISAHNQTGGGLCVRILLPLAGRSGT